MDSRIQKEVEASRQKLIEVRQSTLEARETYQRTSHSVTSKRTSMQHLESRVVSIMGDIETSTRRFSSALLDAGYPPLEEYRLRDAEVLAEEVRLAVEHFDHASTTYAQVKKALQALNEAIKVRDALVDEDFVKQRGAAAVEVQAASDACRNAEAEKERAQEALLVRLNSVQAFAKRYDSDIALDWEALERFMKEHRSKILSVRERLREFEATRQTIESKRKQVAEIQEVLVSLGSKIEERTKNRPTLERAIAERKEAIAQIVGTQTPVSLRAGYERDLEEQKQALEILRREKDATSAAQERWMGQATSMRDRWLSIEKSWTQCMDTFQRHLESLKMTEEEVRLGLLPEERRRSLEQQVRAAELAMAHAEEGVKVLQTQLAALGEIETDPENRARLALEVENQEASLRELTLTLGGLRERLNVDDGAREALKGLREERESAERAMAVWARVGGLIGVNEGASFREFAQTLNLEGLVQRANTQLENLNPRYNLVVAEREGLPTLQFDVIDRYQGNVRRPLTTLSGGESFLVSLALALGLAEFRSLDFPVEILLLDEGFGTLDQDALRMAVSTLHRLEARSAKQVAIISHVEALKEMVRVQIRVEPKGFGRSGLTVVR
jgi:exonuclease SbcC